MRYGVPYVIDLQDPWISDYYERPGAPPPPGGWKYRYVQRLGRTLEGWTMRGVSQLITVSAAYTDVVRQRYPELWNTPTTELPFGSPDPDLAHLRATLKNRPALLPAGTGRLAFAGAIGPGQVAAVDYFFRALTEIRRKGIRLSAHFFGTSYSPDARPATLALAAQYGLQDCVYEQPGRLRYFDALQITLEADANLLFGSTDLAFTPSKILAVLAAGRPVLALAPTGSAMIPRLARLAQPCVTFPPGSSDAAIVREIATHLEAIASGHAAVPLADALANYDARAVAQRQLEILNAASAT